MAHRPYHEAERVGNTKPPRSRSRVDSITVLELLKRVMLHMAMQRTTVEQTSTATAYKIDTDSVVLETDEGVLAVVDRADGYRVLIRAEADWGVGGEDRQGGYWVFVQEDIIKALKLNRGMRFVRYVPTTQERIQAGAKAVFQKHFPQS